MFSAYVFPAQLFLIDERLADSRVFQTIVSQSPSSANSLALAGGPLTALLPLRPCGVEADAVFALSFD